MRKVSRVGVPGDAERVRTRHRRTVGNKGAPQEEYVHEWGSGVHAEELTDAQVDELRKTRKVKDRYRPGKERYERNPHEPIKID